MPSKLPDIDPLPTPGRGKYRRGGMATLTDSDRALLARIRKLDTLMKDAHERRDALIREAAFDGIKYEKIGAACGGLKPHTICYIIQYPYDRIRNPQKPGKKGKC